MSHGGHQPSRISIGEEIRRADAFGDEAAENSSRRRTRRLKKIEADLPLDREMLQDVIKRSLKACPEAGAGRRDLSRLDGFDPSRLWSA
ncbi:hypothetical protein IVB30_31785 [Bradyrhizobium sp. 200]|nr:hypothetical protein IVB30_31785 [Bradyrhizobium sp. 200]